MTQVTTTAQFRVEGGVTDAAPLFVELAIVLSFVSTLWGVFAVLCLGVSRLTV